MNKYIKVLEERVFKLQEKVAKLEQIFVRIPLKKPVEGYHEWCGYCKETQKTISLSDALQLLIDYTGVKYSPEEIIKNKLTK